MHRQRWEISWKEQPYLVPDCIEELLDKRSAFYRQRRDEYNRRISAIQQKQLEKEVKKKEAAERVAQQKAEKQKELDRTIQVNQQAKQDQTKRIIVPKEVTDRIQELQARRLQPQVTPKQGETKETVNAKGKRAMEEERDKRPPKGQRRKMFKENRMDISRRPVIEAMMRALERSSAKKKTVQHASDEPVSETIDVSDPQYQRKPVMNRRSLWRLRSLNFVKRSVESWPTFSRYSAEVIWCSLQTLLVALSSSSKSSHSGSKTLCMQPSGPGFWSKHLKRATPAAITKIRARQIYDSRGNPTVEVDLSTNKGEFRAIVPSGASTGLYEDLELRDNVRTKYMGKEVLKAVQNVNERIAPALVGMDPTKQEEVDAAMMKLDGTDNKGELVVSLAVGKAGAAEKEVPLYQHIADLGGNSKLVLPVPAFSIINGGSHAGNKLAMQEFMVLPVGAESFAEAMRMGSEVHHHLKTVIKAKYGIDACNVALPPTLRARRKDWI